MEKNDAEPKTLVREFGLITVTLLVVGMLVGSGIFQKIIPMAKTNLNDYWILMAWLIGGVISILGAFTVGGLASLTEESGGTYEYFKIAFGKFFSFISGWADFMIIGTGASAAIAFLFADSVNHVIPIPNPLHSLEAFSIGSQIFPFRDFGIKIVAIITVVFLTLINAIGTKESGMTNNIITSVKILGILLIILLGFILPGQSYSTTPEIVFEATTDNGFSFVSNFFFLLIAALWAYEGWTYAANVTGEVINPKRNMPLALSFGIGLTIIIYILINFIFIHVLSLPAIALLNDNDVAALRVAEVLLGKAGINFVLILVMVCTLGAINSNIISLPRKYFRMAQEGFFFRSASRVNSRFKTPVNALIYSMVWTCILIFSGSFNQLTDLVIFIGYIFYGMLGVALIKLKINGTIKEKVFGYPFAPIIFVVCAIALTIIQIWNYPEQSLIGLSLTIMGIPFYFYFKNSFSKMPLNSTNI